jgi:O-antigen/teichoic acid export membrane protein
MCGRYLGPQGYGLLCAYITVWIFVHNVSVSFQTSVLRSIRRILQQPEKGLRTFLAALRRQLFRYAALLALLFVILGIPLQWFLHHSDFLMLLVFSIFCAFWIFVPVTLGVFQGIEKFTVMGIGIVTPYFFRLVFSAAAIALGLSVTGIGSAMLVELVVTAGVFAVMVKRASLWSCSTAESDRSIVKETLRYGLFLSLTTFSVSVLMNSDVLLARHLFPENEAGHFAAAAVLGKVPVYVILSITAAFVPRIVSLKEAGGDWFRFTNRRLAINTGLLLCGCFGIYFMAPLVVSVLYGEAYQPAAELLKLYGIMAIFHGILQTLVQVVMAAKLKAAQVMASAAIITGVAIAYVLGRDPRGLIMSYIAINTAVAVMTYGIILRARPRPESVDIVKGQGIG